MIEPESILEFLENYFRARSTKRFTGKKILITAGPTYEAIDPVRFIGNHSSGKMGFSLAKSFAVEGADVTVIHGPVNMVVTDLRIKKISVSSAADMYEACTAQFPICDIFISAAAVADFTPVDPSSQKIKKTYAGGNLLNLQLKPTKDILHEMSKFKQPHQIVIGFALETHDELENARKKLIAKNLDMIIINSLADKGAGFQYDTNKISILDKHNNLITFELKTKAEAAQDIVNTISHQLYA
jgi:phosphopantothenoylcysteine decarboxylase/phosphopantothenate--cysteine ligase